VNKFNFAQKIILLKIKKENFILPRLKKILSKIGKVQEVTSQKYTYFSLLNYEKGERNLKIEISKRNLGSKYEVKNYLGFSMQSMVKEDIFANKLIALLTRKRPVNRDVFDTWFLLKNRWDINWELVEKRTNLNRSKFVKKTIEYLENWPLESTLNGLGELMDTKTKNWAKKNLLKDTIFLLKANFELE